MDQSQIRRPVVWGIRRPQRGLVDLVGAIQAFQNYEQILLQFSGGSPRVIELRCEKLEDFANVFDGGHLFGWQSDGE